MKKLLRWILIFLVLALMAALSTITALACSPTDSNPEHHENIIQTGEEKATCLTGGYYVLECTVCGMSCTYQTDPAMPHSYGPWEIVPGKEPTCTQSGTKRAYCSTCNKWYEMPAPPTDHFWVTWKQVFATCTTSGYTEFVCDDCGADGGTITTPALGHSFGEWFTTTQATCTNDGIQKRECTRPSCSAMETRTVSKTGHKFGAWFTTTQATCMEEGIQTRECTQCGVTERRGIAKTDHSWDAGTVVVQPTAKREGVMEWICNMCGMSRTTPIPKLASGTTAAPTTAPSTSPAASPSASPTASPSASPTASPSASPGAAGIETADKNGKGEKSGGKGDRHGAGENAAEPDDGQKKQNGDAPEGTAKNGSSVGRILLLVLVPVLLIDAVVIFLLVRRKKTGQP